MSHSITIKVSEGSLDRSVLDRAAERCGLAKSRYEGPPGYNIEGRLHRGYSIELPGWNKRVVFNDTLAYDPHTGKPLRDTNGNELHEVKANYDNYNPTQGYRDLGPLEQLKAAYDTILTEDTMAMAEEARNIARRNGQTASVVEEEDGLVVVRIALGG